MVIKKNSTKVSAKKSGTKGDDTEKVASLKKKKETKTIEIKKKSKLTETAKEIKPKVKKETKPKVKKETKPKAKKKVEKKKSEPVEKEKAKIKEKEIKKTKDDKKNIEQVVIDKIEEEVVPEKEIKDISESVPQVKQKIKVTELVTVKELAEKLNIKVVELIKKFMASGILATINQRLELDLVALIAEEFGYEIEIVPLYGEDLFEGGEEIECKKIPRSPVVTIMGHVDHGKTSLLDAIRNSKITEKEVGKITQHIGAYKVKLDKGAVVFLDTPGHEAFTAMRSRGAHITDIIVLVVAADDGVMPQTIEAIDHAKAAGVPIIVAVNKVDLPTANVQRIKQDLANLNLLSEDWGGKTIFVEVSAKTGKGLSDLLELIVLESEMLELTSDLNSVAQGTVVEARIDSKRGNLTTVLVQQGTLKIRDYFVSGLTCGRVKAMIDDHGKPIHEAGPSTPVEIMGFNDVPHAGDKFKVTKEEKKARHISQMRQQINREDKLNKREHISLENLHAQIEQGKLKDLKIIIKADVRGSVEVLKDSLEKLSTEKIKLAIIHSGVGGINEADILLASASDALIIGFNVRPEQGVSSLAENENVNIKTYRIIYELIADVTAAMEGLLVPQLKEFVLGKLEVRQVFKVPKLGTIAGCYVKEGKIPRNASLRLLRDNIIIYEGKISSLRHFKDDIKEAQAGYECGIGLENFQDIKVSDIIEAFEMQKIASKL